jgi:SAM-dependent methyltransferase
MAMAKPTDRSNLMNQFRGALANCGGWNPRGQRFAGQLAEDSDAAQRLGILHSLILSNGVRKTTNYGRNVELVREVLPWLPDGDLSVLDVGASSGTDAKETLAALGSRCTNYVLADLYSNVVVDSLTGRVFDEDGVLLQQRLPVGFISFQYSYNFGWQRTALKVPSSLWNRAGVMLGKLPAVRPKQISLLDPEVLADRRVSQVRFDVFSGANVGAFDLIICLHLLVSRYFDDATIQDGLENLKAMLKDGGVLVAGDLEDPWVFRHTGGQFVMERGPKDV